ncbi:DUF368 domain-containing protein [Alkalicoccus halolimnae]|uniref:DUF368 domain-containing protein n=1 Tax=Alkalicoccus halolimnae TaxID=1667239 RepID=A0A5C7FJP3_9BACI|nr:DUF368 domain-containing protein [Alkalicoccus halolimnae]TXF86514.1 DUF368 domain-containing protein [Alkalicoccus halolimnae]
MHWKNLYRGFLMGICDIIPGVSGGTMALVLGIYENFIQAISGFFSREWKKHIGFLIPLGVGMITAIIAFANIIAFLLDNYAQETNFMFTGLLVGVLPLLFKHSHFKTSFKPMHAVLILTMAALALSVGLAADSAGAEALQVTSSNAWMFFLAGWIASMAMLLPGVSGAFVLLLFGVYQTATNALSITNPDFIVIALVGSGVILGFILSSKGIKYLFKNFPSYTYAGIIGLIIGAVFTIYPGLSNGNLFLSSLTFAAGVAIAYVLGMKEK